jgi:hypothetical protein
MDKLFEKAKGFHALFVVIMVILIPDGASPQSKVQLSD